MTQHEPDEVDVLFQRGGLDGDAVLRFLLRTRLAQGQQEFQCLASADLLSVLSTFGSKKLHAEVAELADAPA